MYRSKVFLYIILTVCYGFSFVQNTKATIIYTTVDLGSNRWQYTYEVSNIFLAKEIKEFTIWFDYGLYDTLEIETEAPLSDEWDEVVWQPEPVIADDGGYDALALVNGIGPGQTVNGFSVSFDWLGTAQPGAQYFEIIDPQTFATIHSGYTVPEPGFILLLGAGGLGLLRRRIRR